MFNVLIETSATICIIFGFCFLYFNHFNLDDTFLQGRGSVLGKGNYWISLFISVMKSLSEKTIKAEHFQFETKTGPHNNVTK